jgi:hypothetical protein
LRNASAKEQETPKESAAAFGKQAHTVPDEFSLEANYPNPFRTSTQIRFALPKAVEVSLEVYDMLGRRVARLAKRQMEAGFHRARLDGSDLSSGVYVYRLVAGNFAETKRMVLARGLPETVGKKRGADERRVRAVRRVTGIPLAPRAGQARS